MNDLHGLLLRRPGAVLCRCNVFYRYGCCEILFFAENNIEVIHMAGVPFRGFPENAQKCAPAGIKTQRKHGPVDPQRVRVAQERFGLAGITQVAREKLGRFQDKPTIHIYGVARIHEGQVTARTVIVEKAATMRVLRHPGGRIHGHALVGNHRLVV